MRDVIWTLIIIWVIYKIIDVFKNTKQKSFSKYIRPTKAIYSNEVLGLLASYFQISTREVTDYCNIITKQDVIEILLQTGTTDKEIKKLLK